MVVISLRSDRSGCRVRGVIVLPVDVHETLGGMSFTMHCTSRESYLVTNEDREDRNEDDVNGVSRLVWTAILRRIGIASLTAATT